MKLSLYLLPLTAGLLLACQSTPRLPVPANNPPVTVVQNESGTYKGKPITWGGVILQTHTKPDYTEIIVLSKKLSRSTRPLLVDESLGRFIAKADGFLDPALYAPGREVTIHGTIAGTQTRRIGDYEYQYPLVSVTQYYLWPPRPVSEPYDPFWHDPWYYDPWYGPWYYPYPHSHRHIRSVEPK